MAEIYRREVAVYDDSFQPDGVEAVGFGLRLKFKKLRHSLMLTVDGPENAANAVTGCIEQGAVAAAATVLASSFLGVGIAGTGAAWDAFLAQFVNCAGNQVHAKIDDHSTWIHWTS